MAIYKKKLGKVFYTGKQGEKLLIMNFINMYMDKMLIFH